jgi:hypothetical protein
MWHQICRLRTGPVLFRNWRGGRAGHGRHYGTFVLALVLALAMVTPAYAYVGPGAGLTVIGTLLAIFSAVGLAILGFIWYPVKRLLVRRRPAAATPDQVPAPGTAVPLASRDSTDSA